MLAACGGSGTGGAPSFPSAVAASNASIAAADRIADLGLTAPADIPRSGTATYDGVLVVRDLDGGDVNPSVAGGLRVTVDFANAANVTGTAANLRDVDNTLVDGSLTLSNVVFDSTAIGGGFDARLTGRLRNVGAAGAARDYDYQLQLAQIFYGDDAQAMLGLVEGGATAVGRTFPEELNGATTLERR